MALCSCHWFSLFLRRHFLQLPSSLRWHCGLPASFYVLFLLRTTPWYFCSRSLSLLFSSTPLTKSTYQLRNNIFDPGENDAFASFISFMHLGILEWRCCWAHIILSRSDRKNIRERTETNNPTNNSTSFWRNKSLYENFEIINDHIE